MQGLRLCSKPSVLPYYIEEQDVNIYSIEELAYYLYNHACFIEESFFSEELVDYIQHQLQMPKLAAKLRYLMNQKDVFREKLLTVLEASGYYNEEELLEVSGRMEELLHKSDAERMKLRADFLYKKGDYYTSEKLLWDILQRETMGTSKDITTELLGMVYLGLGKIKMQRFLFQEAKEDFAKAYGYCQEDVIAKAFIRSILLMLDYEGVSGADLVVMVKERQGMLEIPEALIIEAVEELKRLLLRSEATEEYQRIEAVTIGLKKNNLDNFYQGIQDIVEDWKKEYRLQFDR